MAQAVAGKNLTPHRKRVLAAMLALERTHGWSWWSQDAIGHVVNAGGYHQIIQKRTIETLQELGLVMSQARSWSPEMVAECRCGCACHRYGLTDAGREVAEDLYIRLTDDTRKRMADMLVACELINFTERGLARENDDEDDDERY